MKLMRVKDHGAYHRMSDFEKTCYRQGLPHKYCGHLIKGMSFIDYTYGGEFPKTISAHVQKKWAINLKKNMTRHGEINGIVGVYSAPTDEAAFECAGSIFEAGMRGGLTCRCLSGTMVKNNFKYIPPSDMYLIYGITDTPDPTTAWAVRDFLRERDGSLRLVVMTASTEHGPWHVIHNVLKMNFNVLLAVSDENNISGGSLEALK